MAITYITARPTSGRHFAWRHAAGRAVGALAVIVGVATLVFVVGKATHQTAGLTALGPTPSPEQLAEFNHEHGLDQPIIVQYVRYLGRLIHGDFGTSLVTDQSIASMIAHALPVTASLALLATIVAAVLSLLLGSIAALGRGRWIDRGIRVFSSLGQAVPVFWLAVLAIQVVAVGWKFVPSGGYVGFTESVGGWLHSMVLPVLVLSVPYASVMTRVVRTSMIEQLDRDYVRTARGLGLTTWTIMIRNVLRNGLIAPVNVLGLNLGSLFGGAVFVEAVFRLPGIGGLIVTAVTQRDFDVVAAASTIAGIAFVVINLFTDLLSSWLNPRKAGEI